MPQTFGVKLKTVRCEMFEYACFCLAGSDFVKTFGGVGGG